MLYPSFIITLSYSLTYSHVHLQFQIVVYFPGHGRGSLAQWAHTYALDMHSHSLCTSRFPGHPCGLLLSVSPVSSTLSDGLCVLRDLTGSRPVVFPTTWLRQGTDWINTALSCWPTPPWNTLMHTTHTHTVSINEAAVRKITRFSLASLLLFLLLLSWTSLLPLPPLSLPSFRAWNPSPKHTAPHPLTWA